jgi:DNA-binding transcriptional LysR family regulator
MDRITSMAVFKRAVDDGSFAAAARHFGISPEMAGAHVRSLETRLGARLLNRTTRRLHLTEVGTGYYARCASILADIDEAEAEASSLQVAPRGLLRIAAPVTFGVRHIAPAVSDYVARHPEVSVDVVVSDRLVNLIEEGFDLAIRVGELQESSLIARRLTSTRLVVCAAPAYLRRAGRPQTPSDLRQHACLIYTETLTPTTWRFERADGHVDTVHVSGTISSSSAEFIHQLVLAGHGVVLAPSFSVGMDIMEERLTALLTDWRSRALPIHVLYPHRPLLSAKVRTFVDFIAERFGPAPEWERWRERTYERSNCR